MCVFMRLYQWHIVDDRGHDYRLSHRRRQWNGPARCPLSGKRPCMNAHTGHGAPGRDRMTNTITPGSPVPHRSRLIIMETPHNC